MRGIEARKKRCTEPWRGAQEERSCDPQQHHKHPGQQEHPLGGISVRLGVQRGGSGPTVLDVVTYFLANWEHDDLDDPIRTYEEVSEERYELRKVEEFADSRLIRSDRVAPELSTSLSWEPVPTTDEIRARQEFTVEPLTADAFESVWALAADAS